VANLDLSKKLYRARDEKMLGGVCGGLGEYFGIDPTFVRLFLVLTTFYFGLGLIAYPVLWLLVPLEPELETGSVPGLPEGEPSVSVLGTEFERGGPPSGTSAVISQRGA
jgi:phage shock protein C